MNVKQVYDLLKKDIRHRIRQTSKDLSDWEPQEDIVTFGTGLAWLDNGQKTPGTGGIKTFLTGRNGLTYDFIDLDQYYTKDEIDKLLDDEKKAREEADQELSDWAKESFVYSISASGDDHLTLEATAGTNSDGYKTYSITGTVDLSDYYTKEETDNLLSEIKDSIPTDLGVTAVKATSLSDIIVAMPTSYVTGQADIQIGIDEEALEEWLKNNGFDPGSVDSGVTSVIAKNLGEDDDTQAILKLSPLSRDEDDATGAATIGIGVDKDALNTWINKYINITTGVTSIEVTSDTLTVTPAGAQNGNVSINLEYTGGHTGAVDSVLIQHLTDDTTEILTIDPTTEQTGNVVFNLGIDEDSLNAWLKTNGYGQGTTFKYYEEGNNSAYVGGCGDDNTSYGRLEVDLYGSVYLETGKSNAWEHRLALDSSGDLTLRHGQGIDSIVYSVFTEENVTAGTNITISKTPEGKFNISATGDVTPYEYYTEDTIDKLAFIKVDDSLVYVNSQGVSVTAPKFTYGGCEVATQCWIESNYYNKQEIDELLAAIQGGESIAPCTWIGYGNNDPSSTGGTIERSQLMPNSGTPHAGDAILYFHSNYSDNTKITIATVSSVDGDDVSYSYVTSFDINASSSTSSYKLYSETTSAATIETPDVNYGTISTTWSGGTSNIMTTTCLYNGTILSLVVISLRGIEVDGDIKVDGYSVLTEADCTKTMLANMISEYEYNNSTSTVINSSASRVTIMEVVGTGQAVNFTMSATSSQAPVSIGRERYIIIHNTGTGTYTYNFNAVSSYHLICTDGNTSLTIQPGEYGEISVISDGTNLYIRSASQS